jgi:hypothetical protein
VAADNAASKTAPKRRCLDVESDEDATQSTYAQRAITDLRRVLRVGERAIFSAVAVERMRGLADGPWRTLRGVGLDPVMLAGLIARAGVTPTTVKIAGKALKGYKASDLQR